MCQVLFWIPTPWAKVPIYGFGAMLVIALFVCTWLAGRRAQRVGIAKEHIQDLALYVVICGVIGARITFMIQNERPLTEFFKLWEGGLVFYGSLVGGFVGYLLAYYFVLRKQEISWRKVADVVAPSLAVGLAIGRIGCLLNGCCYGDVACPRGAVTGSLVTACSGEMVLHFPLSAYPRYDLVRKGYQTAAGFTLQPLDRRTDLRSVVAEVEPNSAAWNAGLRAKDTIVAVDGRPNQVLLKVEGSEAVLNNFRTNLAKNSRTIEEISDRGPLPGLEIRYEDPELVWKDEAKAVNMNLRTESTDVLMDHLVDHWPRGQTELQLTVRRPSTGDHPGAEEALPPFTPRTLGLHPTQVYETISTSLLFLVLLAYYPLRRHDGELLALFLIGYAVHRFLNEMLRNDTSPVAFGMTLSENGSIIVLALGVGLLVWLLRLPADYPEPKLV